ncbi:hypothetical protein AS850_02680 [Frondihabitans sp. 762G35]|uniref:phage tail tube protein n=1 Tax=Frondihabitans sp. 762G35 TaxID=1446794 RepID=UPI000D213C48|nr:hypothetical protein [Frondihabitans sp. 762G35]ARC55978.1 hypothetical protein AS850_02680 [Frondihabitans sp. 762G35]
MALNSDNVRVAVTGAWYSGPLTAPAPTTASSALPSPTPGPGYTDLGYVGDDGITETRDRSTNQIRAWQNGALVREPVTESSITYKGTLIETTKGTLELYYGVSVGTDGSVKIDPSKTGGRKKHVIDIIDGDQLIRIYVPSGEITEVGDQVFANGEPIGYEVTVTGYAVTVAGETYSAIKWYSSLAS